MPVLVTPAPQTDPRVDVLASLLRAMRATVPAEVWAQALARSTQP